MPELQPQNRTISRERAKTIANELLHFDFDDEISRVEFYNSGNSRRTTMDYFTIATLLDTVPKTDLTVDDVFAIEDIDELLFEVIRTRIDQVNLNALFQRMDVEGHRHSVEVETGESEIDNSIGMTKPDFSGDEMSFTTQRIDREQHRFSSILCGDGEPRSVDECALIIARDVFNKICNELPEITQHDVFEDALFEAMQEIKNAQFHPDFLVLAKSQFDQIHRTTGGEPRIFGCEVKPSKYIGDREFILADRDYFGYEVSFREPRITIEQNPQLQPYQEHEFAPFGWKYRSDSNWVSVRDDAVQHCHVNNFNLSDLAHGFV